MRHGPDGQVGTTFAVDGSAPVDTCQNRRITAHFRPRRSVLLMQFRNLLNGFRRIVVSERGSLRLTAHAIMPNATDDGIPLDARRWKSFRAIAFLVVVVCSFTSVGFGQTDDSESPGVGVTAAHHEHSESATEQHSTEEHSGHADPVAPILIAIAMILLAAKVCGDIFERVGMPAVLGELVVGIFLGNFALLTGFESFDFLKPPAEGVIGDPYSTGAVLKMLAGIGVVLLLFEVGLESQVREMLSVGLSSLLVAFLGVFAPILLGWSVGYFLLAEEGWQVHAFLGATLCATSVGITARVLKDLGRSQQTESRIILGAAVIDDVLGLIVLAVVSGIIQKGGAFEISSLLQIVGLAIGFLALSLLLGAAQFPRLMFRLSSYLRGRGLLVATALFICFGFSYGATLVGLAPIIGAFAAGLILDGAHYREAGTKWENRHLEDALAPLSAVFVPIFFVGMGIQVDLSSFRDPTVWGLATALTIAAIIGKQVCAWGVREKELNRTAVGLGMIPRGEVGLIFASVGHSLRTPAGERVVSDGTFSAIVVMVIVTTMVTPPLLKWSLSQDKDSTPKPPEEQQAAEAAITSAT